MWFDPKNASKMPKPKKLQSCTGVLPSTGMQSGTNLLSSADLQSCTYIQCDANLFRSTAKLFRPTHERKFFLGSACRKFSRRYSTGC
jgi:hypothetical protein